MNTRKAFIFDLDGVIVDTAKHHYLAWKKLANGLGFDISENQNEQLKGVSRVKSLEKILQWGNVQLAQDKFMEQMAMKNDNYLSYVSTMTSEDLLPGVAPVIDYLYQNNIPFALGSASKNARNILERTELIQKFDAIVDGNEVSKAKPNPEVFLIAAERLKVEPENCFVIEDAVAGIQAANAANMTSIGIGDKDVLQEADFIFSNFSEIDLEFIKKLINQ